MGLNNISIKLDDITCLDAAEVWIDKSVPQYVVLSGLSKMVSVEVFGQIDTEEQVIVDFSNLKSALKAFIDDPDTGFDHKLLIHEDVWEREEVEVNVRGHNGAKRDAITITKPNGRIAFHVEGRGFFRVYGDTLEDNLTKYLTECLQSYYGNETLVAVATLHARPAHEFDKTYRATFNYMHGLRNSSSYGCQNIIHGHTSFVQVIDKNGEVDKLVSNRIAEYLDGCYLFNENCERGGLYCGDDAEDDEMVLIRYKSKNRKKWVLAISSQHLLPLDTEPTIENIVKHVVEMFADQLTNAKMVIISEGLTKQGIGYVTA